MHPTPIYETLAMGLVTYALWRLRDRFRPGLLFALYLVLAGAERFLVEFIRRNDDVALGLTQAQLLSVAMIVAGGDLARAQGAPRRALGDRRAAARRPGRGARLDRAQQAAVDRDRRPGDVGGALGAQEGDQVAVLVRGPEPPRRHVARPRARSISSQPPQLAASRSVAKRPVATSLTVTPSAATSRASVFRKPTSAAPVRVRERQPRDRLRGSSSSRR